MSDYGKPPQPPPNSSSSTFVTANNNDNNGEVKLTPATKSIPPINSIPDNLLPHFDPSFALHWATYNAGRLATHQIPIEEFRAHPEKYSIAWGADPNVPTESIGQISEIDCPVSDGASIKIRVYEPKEEITGKGSDGKKPAYINYHGGGWVFGDMAVDAPFCTRVLHATGAVVFDVEYRLAPEFPYPIPIEDSWDAFKFLTLQSTLDKYNISATRIAVGGPSAGGHLSAVIAQRAALSTPPIPLAFQLLVVPVTDMDHFSPSATFDASKCPYPSYTHLFNTVTLNGPRMEYFARHFLGIPRAPETFNNPTVSPIVAPLETLSKVAPALVCTADMDPLKDEGKAYAEKLRKAGVEVQYEHFMGIPHTMALLDGICPEARRYRRTVLEALQKALAVKE